jgi:hypothetical protein
MKLKCDKHNRRVLTVGDHFAHRTGDMSTCDSKSASMRDNRLKTTRTYTIDADGGLVSIAQNKEY